MKILSIDRSQVLTLAHSIKNNQSISFGEAQKREWSITRAQALKNLLNTSIVTSQFIKEDKTVRTAKGTLNASLFYYESKGTGAIQNDTIVKYFDLEINNFRCFKKERFVKILSIENVKNFAIAA